MLNCPNILKSSPYSLSFKKFLVVSLACHCALVSAIFANHAFKKPVQKDAIPVSLLFEIPHNSEPSIPTSFEKPLSLKDTEKLKIMQSSVRSRLAEPSSIEAVGAVKPGTILKQTELAIVSAKQDSEQSVSSKLVPFSHSVKNPEVLQILRGTKVKSAEAEVVSSSITLDLDKQVFVKSYPQGDSLDLDRQGGFESQRSHTVAEGRPFKNDTILQGYQLSLQKRARNQQSERQPVSIISTNSPPIYPRISKRLGEEGIVRVRLDISIAGTTTHAIIVQTSGFDRLDEAALRAVKNWKFKPAIKGGRPVETSIDIPVRFTIQ